MKATILLLLILFVSFSQLLASENHYQFISPQPGSENNSRESNIIFRHGDFLDQAGYTQNSIEAKGSKSGKIKGEVILSSDRKTLIFKPTQKLLPNELISVKINSGIKTANGKQIEPFRFQFRTTHLKKEIFLKSAFTKQIEVHNKLNKKTEGAIPELTVNVYDSSAVGEGDVFLAVASETEGIGYYLMVVNNDGTIKYSKELVDDYAYDFKVQPNGLLTYAQFLSHHDYTGGGNCIHMVMDQSLTIVDSFQMGNGYIAEAHDFQMLPNGHVLLFGYYLTEFDMTKVSEGAYPNALVSGGVVQELDVDKNVIFQWRSWDHFDYESYPFSSRRINRSTISAFHLNTIVQDTDGHIIIATPSFGHKINRQTGEVMWGIGGAFNEFSFIGVDSSDGAGYITGHMFHRIANDNFLVYDNGSRNGTSSSKVHEFILDEQAKTAELVWSFEPDTIIGAWHRGNAERLPNGNTFIGWGGASGKFIPTATEVNPEGEVVFEISFDNPDVESYRAFRFPFPDGEPAAEVALFELASNNTYEFSENNINTGISIKINSKSGSGYNEMTVKQYNYAPLNPIFLEKSPVVAPTRTFITESNISDLDAEIIIDCDLWDISQPDSAMIYTREFEVNGVFIPLQTTYNNVTHKLIAPITQLGEFIVAHPDFESVVYTPMLIEPADSTSVNQEESLNLSWTPVGFVQSYELQVSMNDTFTELVIDETSLKDAIYTLDNLIADTAYYWRTRSTNDAGTSEWTEPALFYTIAPFVQVTVPNGGESWQRGLEYFIRWEDNLNEEVSLELYQGDQFVSVIDTVESNGAYKWEVPLDLPLAEDYLIRIKSSENQEIIDLSDVEFSIVDSTTEIDEDQSLVKKEFSLMQNYPNPFNSETQVEFTLTQKSQTQLLIFDIKGRLVKTALNQSLMPGHHKINVSLEGLPTGIFFYTLQTEKFKQTKKMIYLK